MMHTVIASAAVVYEHTPPWFFVSLANQFGSFSVAMADSPTLRYAALGTNETKPDVLDGIQGGHPIENVFITLWGDCNGLERWPSSSFHIRPLWRTELTASPAGQVLLSPPIEPESNFQPKRKPVVDSALFGILSGVIQ